MHCEESKANESENPGPAFGLDKLLRFDARTAERYERERGVERVAVLQHLTYVGLLFYNAYNFTALFLLPDVFWIAVVLRILVVTPASLLLLWIIGRVGLSAREWLLTAGVVNAFAIPAFLFWFSDAPLCCYVFGELALILVYGNLILLRFPQAIVFTTSAFALSVATALTKAGLPGGLRAAFVLQTLTACVWTLYANYRSEAVRCRAYLDEFRATLKSEASEAASNRFLDLSLTDALTTLPNRRALDQTAERWSSEGAALAVMMIDVDHFKLFNDTLGHAAGDECLRSIAAALSGVKTRAEHFVARFGGEEFTVVGRELDLFQATQLARTLVETVEALGRAHPGRRDGLKVVTISVGVALKPIDMDLKTAFKIADDALYVAKSRGRNRYVVTDATVNQSVQLASA